MVEELEGRPLRVNSGPPPPREENSFRAPRGGGRSFDNTNRLYVGNLSWGVDNLALENLFSEQGKVVEAKVVYDRDSGRSRGFGFVTYGSADEVNRAIDTLNGVELDGRQIRMSVAEAPPPRRQYKGNALSIALLNQGTWAQRTLSEGTMKPTPKRYFLRKMWTILWKKLFRRCGAYSLMPRKKI